MKPTDVPVNVLLSILGELFINPDKNHVEVFFYNARKDIAGIFYDHETFKLYAAADTDLIELNATNGK